MNKVLEKIAASCSCQDIRDSYRTRIVDKTNETPLRNPISSEGYVGEL